MLYFPLCREKVTGMLRIEIAFEFETVFCFGIRLAPYAVFSFGFTFNTLHDLWKWSFYKHRVYLSAHPSVWSECSLSAWRNLGSLATQWVHSKDRPDWVDAEADPSLRWAHRSFCWVCRAVTHLIYFGLSYLRQQYWFLLFRCVLFPETPRESDSIYVSMHVYACHRLLCHTAYE